MLGACATAPGPKFLGIATPVKNRGDVYLYRTSAIFAIAQAFEVTLDGRKVGELYNASYLHLRLPAGKFSLKVSPGGLSESSTRQIQPKPGKPIFFQYDFVTGPLANGFFVGSSIDPRSEAQALHDLKALNSAK